MIGVCIGLVVGLLTGFGVEVVMKQSMIVMMLGGVAGVLLGTGFDVIWFWWPDHIAANAQLGSKAFIAVIDLPKGCIGGRSGHRDEPGRWVKAPRERFNLYDACIMMLVGPFPSAKSVRLRSNLPSGGLRELRQNCKIAKWGRRKRWQLSRRRRRSVRHTHS